MMSLDILYQDDYCIAINKPAGMLVHRSWLDKHETQFVMQTLRDQIGQHVFPVHRLDRPTSGVLLFALNSEIARLLALQFEHHQVQKIYWAVVRGYLQGQGQIDYALKPRLDKIADKFVQEDKPAEVAITDYRGLAITEQAFSARPKRYATSRYSLVELKPLTGRKHQLRRHMTHIFHPIVGDTTYGDTAQNRAITQHIGITRLLLHARQLTFIHPITQLKMKLTAPLDEQFQQLMQAFAWEV